MLDAADCRLGDGIMSVTDGVLNLPVFFRDLVGGDAGSIGQVNGFRPADSGHG